jgi:hypothetical protein
MPAFDSTRTVRLTGSPSAGVPDYRIFCYLCKPAELDGILKTPPELRSSD